MKAINLNGRGKFAMLQVLGVLASLLLVTSCGPREQPPTPTATLQPLATVTPIPTATPAPTSTSTYTPPPPTHTPTATATPPPPPVPTDTPAAATVPPTETPTVTPVPIVEVSEARIIYHDVEVVYNDVAKYKAGIQPWLDLLVRVGDTWYGPERQADEIDAVPLPEGYRWETEGSFSSFPTGEAWWTAPGVEGRARLIGPDGSVLYTLALRIEFFQ